MKGWDFFYLGLALIVIVGILAFVIQPARFQPVQEAPSLTLLIDHTTIEVGGDVTLSLSGVHLSGENLQFTDGEHSQIFSCKSDPCSFSHVYAYTVPGVHVLEAQLGRLMVRQSLVVKNTKTTCIDGTPEGACATPPLRCVNARLISDCETCGCETGMVCSLSQCVVPDFNVHLLEISVPTQGYTTAPLSIHFSLRNDSAYTLTGPILAKAIGYDSQKKITSEFPQQIQLSSLLQGNTQPVTLSFQLPEATKFIRLFLFRTGGAVDDSTRLDESDFFPISVSVDSIPPGAPTSLHTSSDSAGTHLEWNASPSEDVSSYVIYQQSLATGGFTTYHVLGETESLTYLLPHSGEQLTYVVRARDEAGNEGDPSTPLVVPAS